MTAKTRWKKQPAIRANHSHPVGTASHRGRRAFMNVALAVVLLTGLYVFHFDATLLFRQSRESGMGEGSSPADKVGIRPGDVISNINGTLQPTWKTGDVQGCSQPRTADAGGRPTRRATLNLTVVPDASGVDRYGSAGWWPEQPSK